MFITQGLLAMTVSEVRRLWKEFLGKHQKLDTSEAQPTSGSQAL